MEKVLTRYPDIGSIRDFGKLFGNPFKEEFFVLLEGRRSLDWIEHQTRRKRGCPMLREEACAAARLHAQLEDQARRFLSDRSRNRAHDGRLDAKEQNVIVRGQAKLAFLD